MLDYADVVAINKFDKRGSLDALRDQMVARPGRGEDPESKIGQTLRQISNLLFVPLGHAQEDLVSALGQNDTGGKLALRKC